MAMGSETKDSAAKFTLIGGINYMKKWSLQSKDKAINEDRGALAAFSADGMARVLEENMATRFNGVGLMYEKPYQNLPINSEKRRTDLAQRRRQCNNNPA